MPSTTRWKHSSARAIDVTEDWLPVRIELSDATSNVDLHPLHYDR